MLHGGYYILCDDPLVVACSGNTRLPGDSIPPLPDWLKPVAILEHASWWRAHGKATRWHSEQQQRLASRGIEHHLVVNADDEVAAMRKCNVRCARFPKSMVTDETIFRPRTMAKQYDAIYIARLRTFKRHELARQIEKLLILTDNGGDLHGFCPAVGHAASNDRKLPPRQVARLINKSRVGLCLSEEEGVARACVEYLLCGIPVVTTPSRGGRDQFLDSDNSIEVQPESGQVRNAVMKLIADLPRPKNVRAAILAQIDDIRKGYCTYLSELFARIGSLDVDPDVLFEKYFINREIDTRYLSAKEIGEPRDLGRFKLVD